MTFSSSLSVSDKIILAAFSLHEEGKNTFTAEDIVVSAWRHFPDTFGLAGFEDKSGNPIYPDSNRVFAEIMGSKPIRQRGYLRKVGTKIYQITDSGIDHAISLKGNANTPQKRKISLSREIELELRHFLSGKAKEKYVKGIKNEISFYDACTFWGISPRSTSIELEGRLASFTTITDRALEIIGEGVVSFEHGGLPLKRFDILILKEISSYMQETYRSELDIIRKRKDERA